MRWTDPRHSPLLFFWVTTAVFFLSHPPLPGCNPNMKHKLHQPVHTRVQYNDILAIRTNCRQLQKSINDQTCSKPMNESSTPNLLLVETGGSTHNSKLLASPQLSSHVFIAIDSLGVQHSMDTHTTNQTLQLRPAPWSIVSKGSIYFCWILFLQCCT